MTASVLFFCGQPLVARPISQRIAAFGAFLARNDWNVRLTAVDPRFVGTPFTERDPYSGMDVHVIGPTHYRIGTDSSREQTSPIEYFGACRQITRRITETASAMGADHIVVSTTLPASLFTVGALRRSRPRVWLDIDDWSAAQFTAGGGKRAIGAAYDACERVVPRLAPHLSVCSKELEGLFPHATLVPNFIRLADVPERAAGPRSGRVRVAFASSVTEYHGHIPLLEALARRRDDCGDVEFEIIGGGDALTRCRELVARAGLGEIVHFTGHVERPTMLEALVRSDISVLPLRDTRLDRARFPLKLLDSLACGCAIAASDAGMAREILVDGATAVLSEPGNMDALVDNVLFLAARPELRARLGESGKRVAARYDEDAVCGSWMERLSAANAP